MARAIETYRGMAYPWLCDTMGHMNTQFYAAMYDTASFHMLSAIAPYAEIAAQGAGWADVRQLIEYREEVRAGTLLVVRTTLLKLGRTSIEFRHDMAGSETGRLHSTSTHVTVLFDLAARKSRALDEAMRQRGDALLRDGP